MRTSIYRSSIATKQDKTNVPQERNRWRGLDAAAVDIPRRAGDNTADNKADDDTDVLEERRPEELRQDDADEREEPNADEFGGAPPRFSSAPPKQLLQTRTLRKGPGREYRGAELEYPARGQGLAAVRAAAPVGDPGGTDEGCADHEDYRPCH